MVVLCVLDVTFYSQIKFQDSNKLICSNKLGSENLSRLRTAIINRLMRLQLIICHKKQ